MLWLYQSGIGATRQLFRFNEIRLPDLAFMATLASLICAIYLYIVAGSGLWLAFPLLCVTSSSFMHFRSKFVLSFDGFLSLIGAIITDTILVSCYYTGRFIGLLVYGVKMIARRNIEVTE